MVIITINLRANKYYKTSAISSPIYSKILESIYLFIFRYLVCLAGLQTFILMTFIIVGILDVNQNLPGLPSYTGKAMCYDWRGNSSWSPFSTQSHPARRLIKQRAVAAILGLIPFLFSGHEHNVVSSQGGWTGACKSPSWCLSLWLFSLWRARLSASVIELLCLTSPLKEGDISSLW